MTSSLPPRSGGTGSKPKEGAPLSLTKPQAQRICQADGLLAPYQDEKLQIYRRHHEAMDVAFDGAHRCCKQNHSEYDDRNREVSEKLEGIKQRTDGEAKRQQDRLKDFSTEFDESVIQRRKDWLGELSSSQAEITGQGGVVSKDISDLDMAIAEEGKACQADTASVTEPLEEALKTQLKLLEQQAQARTSRHNDFKILLGSEFRRLRQRVAQEAEARKRQCGATAADVKKHYAALQEQLQKKDASAKEWLQDIRSKLARERSKRTVYHEAIMKSMGNFMVDLERHLSETQGMHEATRETLVGMRTKLRTSDSP